MTQLPFTNARVFDGHSADCAEGMNVPVADGLILECSSQPIAASIILFSMKRIDFPQ